MNPLHALPDGPFRFIALDVETASAARGSICQLGLAFVDTGNGVASWSCHVDPETRFDPFNTKLHGIAAETVAGAPAFPELWEAVLPLLTPHHLVQHSNFDRRAIEAACLAYRLPAPDLSWTDSVKIARRAWPEFRGNGGHGLGHLKHALGLDFEHHDAGEDARAAAEVVLKAEKRLGEPFETIAQTKRKAQIGLPLNENAPRGS